MTSYNEIIQACSRCEGPRKGQSDATIQDFLIFPIGRHHVVVGTFTSISEARQGSSPGNQTTACNQSESRPFRKRHSCRVLVLIHKQAINYNGRERVEQAGQNPQLITHRINGKRRQPCLKKIKQIKRLKAEHWLNGTHRRENEWVSDYTEQIITGRGEA